jgi:hypothetical protein
MSNQNSPQQTGAGSQAPRPGTPVGKSTSSNSMQVTPPRFYGRSEQSAGGLTTSTSNSSIQRTPPSAYQRRQSISPDRRPRTQYSYAPPGQQAARASGQPNPFAKPDGSARSFGSFQRATQQGRNNGQ